MSGPAYGNQNKSVHKAVCDLAVLFLEQQGITGLVAKSIPKKISDGLDPDSSIAPDIRGLDGVHLAVTSKITHRLSDDLDSARRSADLNGSPIAAFLQWRSERSISEAFVVTSLGDFAKLVRGDHFRS